ncbi:MAG: response regulator [Bryobacteraceae bacterium]|nr:response regulator [Bryobacteraceae bacterium]
MKSILAKIALLESVFMLLVGSLLCVLLERDFGKGLHETFINAGQNIAARVSADVEPALAKRSPAAVQTALVQQLKVSNLEWAYLASPDGEVLAHTFGQQVPQDLLNFRASASVNWFDVPAEDETKPVTVFSRPVSRGRAGTLYIGLSREPLVASVQRMRTILVSSMGAGILFCLLLFTWITRRLLSPIQTLTGVALKLKDDQSGDFQWVAAKSDDELGVLTKAFNGMWAVIQHRTEWLEERVQARTAELSKANAELAVEVVERQRAEREATLAREAAETANRAKSAFVANMSHELRTPMNGIIGMAEFIEAGKLSPQQREYFEIIRSSAQKLLSVINDVLDFSKIEAGTVDLDLIDFDLPALVYETVKPLTLQAEEGGVQLLCNIDPAVPDLVHGDPVRVRQVLTNLVGNAVKFTSKGEILVSILVEASDESTALLHFSVRDSGIGVPKEQQALIFEPFRQADASMTRKFGGTGLGLSICSRLVQLMGGKIWLESEVGQGSTFHFTVRLGRASGGSPSVIEGLEKHLAGLRVLVVDDNATSREILHDCLVRSGMHPVVRPDAFSGFETLIRAEAGSNPFHVLIMELQLPGEDGFALAKRIRKTSALAGLPILLLYSGSQSPDPGRCLILGIGATLPKPVEQRDLQAAILKVLHQQPGKRAPVLVSTSEAPAEAAGLRILLAEDNKVNQLIAKKLLGRLGHFVVVAGDGKAAFEEVKKQHFDLVLMDIQMPEMDGYAATRAIREYEKSMNCHTPIIAMTAHAMAGHKDSCLAAGMEGYVSKPVNVRELEEQINLLKPRKPSPAL